MIKSFADKATFALFADTYVRQFPPDVRGVSWRCSMAPNDLSSPPGNRLEALQGDRAGQYSIRVNQQ